MKSKLLSAIAVPAMLAVGAATAFAQTTEPSPSPAPSAPEQRMPETSPSPAPAPSPSVTDPAPSMERSAGTFSSNQAADEWRSTRLVGQTVYNNANERIGDINDLVLSADGKISTAVIGVGGFLGLGEKLVGIAFSDLKLNREADGSLRITVESTKEALENAPDFKYHDAKAVAQ